MSVYVVAQLKFKDRAAYQRYQARFMPVLNQFAGRLFVADEHPLALEGVWPFEKIVIIQFADEVAARAWSESAEYEEIAKDRKLGADTVAILARGISSSS